MFSCSSFPLEDDRQAHERQHHSLEPRVLGQQDGNVAHERNVADYAANNICLAVQEVLTSGVELGVVCCIVVTLGQELEGRCLGSVSHIFVSISSYELKEQGEKRDIPATTTEPPDNSMHDRDVLAPNIVHHHLSNLCIQSSVPQEQQVSTLEGWLHGSGQYDYDGRRGIGCD